MEPMSEKAMTIRTTCLPSCANARLVVGKWLGLTILVAGRRSMEGWMLPRQFSQYVSLMSE